MDHGCHDLVGAKHEMEAAIRRAGSWKCFGGSPFWLNHPFEREEQSWKGGFFRQNANWVVSSIFYV